jgi:nicotinamidase-related amidase
MPYTEPHWDAAALVTIDVHRCTLDGGELAVPGTTEALERMTQLTRAFREASRPIIHIARLYCPDGSNVDICRRVEVEEGATFLAPGAAGTELAPGLLADDSRLDTDLLLAGGVQEIAPDEVIIYKPRWGAFFQTRLEAHLRSLAVDTLVFCGTNFPNCPRTSIYEASERDFRIVVANDAISGIYERGERELSDIGVTVLSSAQLTQALASHSIEGR